MIIRFCLLTFCIIMNTVRQSCRPKHQVLILKCYPRFQKNVLDVKANASELSYLLYYASTRRSKLQKVGAFLEKRTVVDVSKARIGYETLIQQARHVSWARVILEADFDACGEQKCASHDSDLESIDRENTPRSTALRSLRFTNSDPDIEIGGFECDGRYTAAVQHVLRAS